MRPLPPPELLVEDAGPQFCVADDVVQWIEREILAETGSLHNPDHAHLCYAKIGALWTNVPLVQGGRRIAATMSIPVARDGNTWAKEQRYEQLRDWFGAVPDFLLTIDAVLATQADDVSWCCLIDGHELYHAGQKTDPETGEPLWTKEETPRFYLRGHDVEVFVAGTERYGMVEPNVRELARAAARPPSVSQARTSLACGTCKTVLAV